MQGVEDQVEHAERDESERNKIEIRRRSHCFRRRGDRVDSQRAAQRDEGDHDSEHDRFDPYHGKDTCPCHAGARQREGERVLEVVHFAGVHSVEEGDQDPIDEDSAIHPRWYEHERSEYHDEIGRRMHDEAELFQKCSFHSVASCAVWVMMSSSVAGSPMPDRAGTRALVPLAVSRIPQIGVSARCAASSGATR